MTFVWCLIKKEVTDTRISENKAHTYRLYFHIYLHTFVSSLSEYNTSNACRLPVNCLANPAPSLKLDLSFFLEVSELKEIGKAGDDSEAITSLWVKRFRRYF